MSARFAKSSPWLLASILASLVYGTSWAGPWVLAPNEFTSEVTGGFFSSDTRLDDIGERPGLDGGGAYESRAMLWATELGWKKRVSFTFALPFESVTRQFGVGSRPEFTQTGLSDLVTGLNYNFMRGVTGLSVEAAWKAPLGYNRDLFPPLGNGRQELIGILNYGRQLSGIQAFVQAAGGYRMILEKSDDPTLPKNEALVTADFGWWPGASVLIAGRYRGRFESNEAANPITSHLLGPEVRYRVDDFLDVFAGSWHTASGKNVLHVDEFYAGVTVHKNKLDRLQGFFGTQKKP